MFCGGPNVDLSCLDFPHGIKGEKALAKIPCNYIVVVTKHIGVVIQTYVLQLHQFFVFPLHFFFSSELKCKMKFGIYLPPKAESGKCPVLYWLSGILKPSFKLSKCLHKDKNIWQFFKKKQSN